MTSRTRPFLQVTALFVVALAFTACSKTPTQPAQAAAPAVFAAQATIPVSLTLLQAEGQTGRSSPISSNYRPQVRFPLGPVEANCTVQLPAATPTLEPGQSSSAALSCDAEVRVDRAQPDFTVVEGGKPVGRGSVQVP